MCTWHTEKFNTYFVTLYHNLEWTQKFLLQKCQLLFTTFVFYLQRNLGLIVFGHLFDNKIGKTIILKYLYIQVVKNISLFVVIQKLFVWVFEFLLNFKKLNFKTRIKVLFWKILCLLALCQNWQNNDTNLYVITLNKKNFLMWKNVGLFIQLLS